MLDIQPSQALLDSVARQHTYLRLSVTELCNFKCHYCLPDGYQGKKNTSELSLKEIQTLLEAMTRLGIKKVRITGGEPSLRKDLNDIIALCKSFSSLEKVCISSNGYKLDEYLPQWIASGIDQVNISIDSIQENSFKLITSSSMLPRILSAIEDAHEQGFTQIKTNTVLLSDELAFQFLPLLDWAKDKPMSIRFIERMQTNDSKLTFDETKTTTEKIRRYLLNNHWTLQESLEHAGPAKVFSHHDFQCRVGLISPYSHQFCDTCNRLRVNAVGNLNLCLFSDNPIELRDYLQRQDVDGLMKCLQFHILNKQPQHYLHNQVSGNTANFSIFGG